MLNRLFVASGSVWREAHAGAGFLVGFVILWGTHAGAGCA